MAAGEIESLVSQLSAGNASNYTERQKAAQDLALLGARAKAALEPLRQRMSVEGDEDVRASIVTAIANIEDDEAILVPELSRYLNDRQDYEVRAAAADALGRLGPSAKEALPSLWERVRNERTPDVRETAAKAILAIDQPGATLLPKLVKYLQSDDVESAGAAAIILGVSTPYRLEARTTLNSLWDVLRKRDHKDAIASAFSAILKISGEQDDPFLKLIEDSTVAPWKKSLLILLPIARNALNTRWRSHNELVLPLVLSAVESDDPRGRATAIQFLMENSTTIPPVSQVRILDSLLKCFRRYGQGFQAIKSVGGYAAIDQFLKDPDINASVKGRTLLTEGRDVLERRWAKEKETTLALILAAMDEQPQMRQAAAIWLSEKVGGIPRASYGRVVEALRELLGDTSPEVRNSAGLALTGIEKEKESRASLDIIRGEDEKEDAKIRAIKNLVETNAREELRALIGEWVQWIAADDRGLVESAGDAMRNSPRAVLPLVEQLNQRLQLSSESQDRIRAQTVPIEYKDTLLTLTKGTGDATVDQASLSEWLAIMGNKTEGIAELVKIAAAKGWTNEVLSKKILEELATDEIKAREVKVHRRIARQLSDMSDPKFFDEKDDGVMAHYREIKVELKRHAVPVLGRRLVGEGNVDIRESIAQTLGNVGGHEAIDALARAVAGEERVRVGRQELLAKYYLEPSKDRSEEAAKILRQAVTEAERTLRLYQNLNVWLFSIGLLLVLFALILGVFSHDLAGRVTAALSGVGGLAFVFAQMIAKPIEQVQDAMANLVQVETAFTSFIWELNLNGTYIQSQYVAEGILTDGEIAQTVERIERAMNHAMNLIATYSKHSGQRLVTRINKLFPAAGQPGTKVTISGQYLQGDTSEKKQRSGTVAINHRPMDVSDLSWSRDEVSFKLPPKVPGLGAGEHTIWVSLLVDGMETNALPFHIYSGELEIAK